MKRYKIETNYILNCTARMKEDKDGEWIRYSDHMEEMKKLKENKKV